MQLEATPIELRWPVFGDRVKKDCGYRLYSALAHKIPRLKSTTWQLGGFTGSPDGQFLKLGRGSELVVRCKVEDIALFGSLDNQILEIGQSLLRLGELVGGELRPAESLTSDLVIIKLYEGVRFDPLRFAVSLGKQLQILGISEVPEIGDRAALIVKEQQIVGFPVRFCSLQPAESIALQSLGLGGKRRMGCGVFLGPA